MKRTEKIADVLLMPLGLFGELAVALMCIHIVVDVFASALFQSPLEGTTEVVARWYMVALVFLPLALVQRFDGHIKAEIFTDGLPRRQLLFLESATSLLMAIMAAGFGVYTGLDAVEATQRREAVELMRGSIPVWPTRWFVPIGFAALALVSFSRGAFKIASALQRRA